MIVIEDKPHCFMEYDPAKKCVNQTWKGFASSENFRASVQKVIDLSSKHTVESVISNTQDEEIVSKEDTEWVASYANPILIQRGLRKIAFIVPKNMFGRWSIDRFFEKSKGQSLKIRYFRELSKAQEWVAE